jgi:hypothetical protein
VAVAFTLFVKYGPPSQTPPAPETKLTMDVAPPAPAPTSPTEAAAPPAAASATEAPKTLVLEEVPPPPTNAAPPAQPGIPSTGEPSVERIRSLTSTSNGEVYRTDVFIDVKNPAKPMKGFTPTPVRPMQVKDVTIVNEVHGTKTPEGGVPYPVAQYHLIVMTDKAVEDGDITFSLAK